MNALRSDRGPATTLYHEGEWVTRENGTRVAQIARGVTNDDIVSVHQFKNWQIEAPREGDRLIEEPDGQRWVMPRPSGGMMLHIEGKGWT